MIATSLDEIADLYARWGDEHYDEALSQRDHALQTAALAEADGASDELIVAALLHDVGHLLDLRAADREGSLGGADRRHDTVGARYLADVFPPAVTDPIAGHVQAKRYLCAIDAGYHDALSDGSKRSLERQGGPMSPTEVAAFELEPGFDAAVRLRRWDDGGKLDGVTTTSFDERRPLLTQVTARRWINATLLR